MPESLDDLKKRRNELLAFMTPLAKQVDATSSHKEKRALREKGGPSFNMYKALVSKIEELEKATSNLSTSPQTTSSIDAKAVRTPTEKTVTAQTTSPTDAEAVNTPAHNTVTALINEAVEATINEAADFLVDEEVEPWTQITDEEEVEPWTEITVDPSWILNSNVLPKEPKRVQSQDHGVLRFIAGGKVYCFGHLDKTAQDNVVQVLPVNCAGSDTPFFGIHVKFPRDKIKKIGAHSVRPSFHTILYKFLPCVYTIKDHLVTDEAEFQEFLQDAPQHVHAKAKEAKLQNKLYRITFSYDNDGIEQCFYPSTYSSSVPEVQAIFEAMAPVPGCWTLSLFMLKYDDLPASLQYLYQVQKDYVSFVDA